MAKLKPVCHFHLLLFVLLFSFHLSTQHQPSESQSLLQIRELLNYPQALANFDNFTDFCDTESTPSLTIVCYEGYITQLHIVGEVGRPTFQQNTSADFLFSTFSQFPNLKVLSLVSLGFERPLPPTVGKLLSLEILNLSSNSFYGSIPEEISSLKSLQTLILDYNHFSGNIPSWIDSLSVLTTLSLQNNSFNGSLPDSITHMWSLRVLSLSKNSLSGKVPDLSNLTNMQVLDLGDNLLGSQFPKLPKRLSILVLKNNRFRSGIPAELAFLYRLEKLDISSNKLVGPFLASLLGLPSIKYLNIGGNRLTGLLLRNISCNSDLTFVNLSSNLLTGDLPTCLQQLESKNNNVIYTGNCLSNKDQEQHPLNFCHNEALAVSIKPHNLEHRKGHRGVMTFLRIFGGSIAGIIVVALVFFTMRRTYKMGVLKEPPTRFVTENSSVTNTAKQLYDAKYISQTMKLGTSLPPYRTFTLDELKEATNNFDASTLISESTDGQIFKGMFTDGSIVAIRSLTLKRRQTPQTYMHQLELISKLRHSHLVSALGHCYEILPDGITITRVFLIFEYYPYGTLRSHVSGLHGQKLFWTKRISAAIEVVKGIQFLHTGIVPGVYSNNLKITDILLDQDLRVKISSYNLPIVVENGGTMISGVSSTGRKGKRHAMEMNHADKDDVYDIGVILLEIILGRQITSQNEVHVSRDLLQVSLKTDDIARRSIADPAVHKGCSDESLKTMMEICVRCLHDKAADRPSVDDILWNLHFAGQVQDLSRDNTQNSQNPPASPSPSLEMP
ncbi:probable inactive leucine-rich repeat receptor-like protein kinase At3g03770 [Cucurbita maxima]|uniref:Probable inactive leucine-rich repeat receptor-like protein kinase At3g03770 n=1 Tax=Cucurbita maxima TaxID=3661 RepID=A0A6J1JSQ3_CUCMA|nr:probable inactive leucine-rich repeat receptor-like protein kinase At3g03770 [Cucurbita maxima]XP_022990245.1 probable inactive leucine-rich repeat receptor-like protein kinase At3g03770 [Cucurbita maxima]XP_022990246.1 probable inactive leucine-rich repeat receptor-like protein kinase At3g03770 [Cucurbita maxima]XP_022990247.1 probable inactive leucine-rich repeat receptor-like protein kinase At3g03770 [Cucurbita maxima]XP_022990248.1 probable inactive leucine-rich repeat receptor-like prot